MSRSRLRSFLNRTNYFRYFKFLFLCIWSRNRIAILVVQAHPQKADYNYDVIIIIINMRSWPSFNIFPHLNSMFFTTYSKFPRLLLPLLFVKCDNCAICIESPTKQWAGYQPNGPFALIAYIAHLTALNWYNFLCFTMTCYKILIHIQ